MEFSAHILVLIQMSQDVLEHLSGVLRMSVLKYVLNMLLRTKVTDRDLPSLSATGCTPPAGQGHGCTVGVLSAQGGRVPSFRTLATL